MPDDELSWSVKEVYGELKKDIMKRFDTQDVALIDIRHELSNTATKEDVRELHQRVDGVERRTQRLEDHQTESDAVAGHKRRINAAVLGVASIAAIIGAALIGVFVH